MISSNQDRTQRFLPVEVCSYTSTLWSRSRAEVVSQLLQVEQRSELVDVVTKLAKEEAAAEKGAAAAAAKAASSADAKPDGDVGGFEVVEVLVSDMPSKGNAAAALKQVFQTINSCLTYIKVASLCSTEHQSNRLLVYYQSS